MASLTSSVKKKEIAKLKRDVIRIQKADIHNEGVFSAIRLELHCKLCRQRPERGSVVYLSRCCHEIVCARHFSVGTDIRSYDFRAVYYPKLDYGHDVAHCTICNGKYGGFVKDLVLTEIAGNM